MYSYLYSIVNWQINFENKYDASWPDCSLAGLFWIWKWFFIRTWIWLNLGVANCKKGRTDLPLFFFLWNRSSETRVHFSSILMIWQFFSINSPGPLIQRHFILLVQHSFFVKTSIATQFLNPTGYIISAKKKSIYYVPILEFKFQTGKRPSKFNIFANISTISIYTMYILCIK